LQEIDVRIKTGGCFKTFFHIPEGMCRPVEPVILKKFSASLQDANILGGYVFLPGVASLRDAGKGGKLRFETII